MARLALGVWLVHFNKAVSLRLESDSRALLQREMGQSCSLKHTCAHPGAVTRSLAASLLGAGWYLNCVRSITSAPLTRGVGGGDVSSAPKQPDGGPEGGGLAGGCERQELQRTASMHFPLPEASGQRRVAAKSGVSGKSAFRNTTGSGAGQNPPL